MKRFLSFFLISLLIVILSFGIFKITKRYSLDVIHDEIDWSINVKGCKNSTGFDIDNKGNMFISFKDSIRMISSEGKDVQILKDDILDILDFVCDDKNLYIATDNRILEYSLDTKEYRTIINNIPNNGVNREVKLLLNDEKLLVCIGSNTNSGIVSSDGLAHDNPAISFTLSGVNYGDKKTSIYKPYGVPCIEGERVDDNGNIGNATIMEYDLKHNEISIYSHGIRNVEGIDINSKNEIYAIVGGMEDDGLRPVKDDCDYIYKINESAWYGWPDFSGGDPINSPRFSDGTNKLSFLIKDHPNKTPSAPLYEHSTVSSLRGLAIDYEGYHFNKDQIIFGDNKEHKIYALDRRKAVPIGTLDKSSNIEKILVDKQGVFILDSGTGCIYKFSQKGNNYLFNLSPVYWIFACTFLIILLFMIVYKSKVNK